MIVAARRGARRVVVAADVAARALGVVPGATVALAQAMTPGLTVVEAEPEADAAALERLAVWALRYTPLAAADPPDGLVLDVAGATHLHGGDAGLLADLSVRLDGAGIAARAAVADSWAAAWGLARHAPGTVAPVGAGLAAVAHLPASALRLDTHLAAALRRIGFDHVGDLDAAPRASLALRFGRSLTARLDAAAGRAFEAIDPALAPTLPHARLAFAEPLGHLGGLERALRDLAADLCAVLEGRGLGARRLDLRLHRVDGHVAALRVGTARATRDATHMVRLFGERLATVDPGFGVEATVLAATLVEALGAGQLTTDAEEDVAAGLAALVDRVAARIGERRVYRLAVVESDMPERCHAAVPALSPPTGRSWADGPRPHRLFDPPHAIEVVALLPDHPPAVYTWAGRRHRVTAADGPESVAGEWWADAAEVYLTRDYYRVEDADGLRVWLFRATRPPDATRWFLHGVFA